MYFCLCVREKERAQRKTLFNTMTEAFKVSGWEGIVNNVNLQSLIFSDHVSPVRDFLDRYWFVNNLHHKFWSSLSCTMFTLILSSPSPENKMWGLFYKRDL